MPAQGDHKGRPYIAWRRRILEEIQMAYRMHLMVCAGTGCVSNRSLEFRDALQKEIEKRGLDNEIQVVTTGCNGFCGVGPSWWFNPMGFFTSSSAPKTFRISWKSTS